MNNTDIFNNLDYDHNNSWDISSNTIWPIFKKLT